MPIVSLFENLQSVDPEEISFETFDALKSILQYRIAPSKHSVPLFVPARFRGTRKAENVAEIHYSVLDLDDVPIRDYKVVIRPILEKFRAIVYSTWSYSKAKPQGLFRGRVIVDLTRPILPDEWKRFRQRFCAVIGHRPKSENDPCRLYYLPSGPCPRTADTFFWEEFNGAPLDVDSLLHKPLEELTGLRATQAVLRDRQQTMLKLDPKVGQALDLLIQGQPFALKGSRDDTLYRVLRVLIRELSGTHLDEMLALFKPSIDRMRKISDDAPTLDTVAEKYTRLREQIDLEKEKSRQAVVDRRQQMLRRSGRDTCYTEKELCTLAEQSGVTRDELNYSWVVLRGTQYWVLGPQGYVGPYQKSEVSLAAEVLLAPAQVTGVSVSYYSEKQDRWCQLRADTIISEYGRVAQGLIYDFAARMPRIEGDNLVLSPCPLRTDIEPAYSNRVNTWLRALGGDSSELLLDWLATVSLLHKPNSALYLAGAPGAAKTELANACSKLWTKFGPSDMCDALGWSESILQCPLVLADERVPEDARGRPRTADIRKVISQTHWQIKCKHIKNAIARGAIRVILTANNFELLTSAGELTADDVKGLTDRILCIHVTNAAVKFRESLTPQEQAQMFDIELPAHILWLTQNRQVQRGRRFFVDGQGVELMQNLTHSGLRSCIVQWLVSWILSPDECTDTRGQIKVDNKRVVVQPMGLVRHWHAYETGYTRGVPAVSTLTRALSELSEKERVEVDGRDYYSVQLPHLLQWIGKTLAATPEQLFQAIDRLDQKKKKKPDWVKSA